MGASIQRSYLWHHVEVFHLTENMCVDPHDPQSAQFVQWLSDVGQGKDLPLDHSITHPQHMICGPAVSDIISAVYPDLQTREALPDTYYLERAILCPRNSEVDEINEEVLKTFPREERLYSSANSIKGSEEDNHYPVEYLNTINMGGPAQTQDWDLMLLQNLDLSQTLQ